MCRIVLAILGPFLDSCYYPDRFRSSLLHSSQTTTGSAAQMCALAVSCRSRTCRVGAGRSGAPMGSGRYCFGLGEVETVDWAGGCGEWS